MSRRKDDHVRYVYLLSRTGKAMPDELVRAHVAHLKALDGEGKLVLCGPFADYPGGMVVLKAASRDEARAIAEADPFVASGAETYELRTLQLSCRENDHMGMG